MDVKKRLHRLQKRLNKRVYYLNEQYMKCRKRFFE